MDFRTKICGITTVEDAIVTAEAGADAIGLNFFSESPRCVSIERACEIVTALPDGVAKVGVFVNTSVDDLIDIHDRVGLDFIQMHSDEPPEFIAEVAPRAVIRAFRCKQTNFDQVTAYLQSSEELGCLPKAILLDAYQPGAYGGTGKVVDWNAAAQLNTDLGETKIVLAGGLTPGNVADAIRAAQPNAVDTASGVEAFPGRKDAALVRQFVERANAAFQ